MRVLDIDDLARVMAAAVDRCDEDFCPWEGHSLDYREEWHDGARAAVRHLASLGFLKYDFDTKEVTR